MQGFEAKNRLFPATPSPILRIASLLRILFFSRIRTSGGSRTRVERGSWSNAVVEHGSWKLSAVTITLHSLHQLTHKISYLNQMYEKGNGSIREEKKYRKCSIRQVTSLKIIGSHS